MKRFVLGFIALTALAVLVITFLEDQTRRHDARVTTANPSEAATMPVGRFALKLAPRLAEPPAPMPVTTKDRLARWLAHRSTALRGLRDPNNPLRAPLVFLLGAAVVGFAGGAALRGAPSSAGESPDLAAAQDRIKTLTEHLSATARGDEPAQEKLVSLLSTAQQERDDASSALRSLEAERSDFEDRLNAAEQARHAAEIERTDIEHRLRQGEDLVDELRGDLATAQDDLARIAELTHELGELRGEVSERDETIVELHEDIASWREQWNTLEAEHYRVKQSLDEISVSHEDSSESIRQRDQQIAALESQLGEREVELAAARARAAELADVEARLASWSSTVSTLESDVRDRNGKLESARAEVDNLTAALAGLEPLQGERDRLQENLTTVTARADRLETEVLKLTETESALESELALKDETLRDIEDELEEREQQLRALAARQEFMAGDITGLETDNARKATMIEESLAQVENQAATIERLEADIESWQDKIPPLESSNSILSQGMESLREDLADMVNKCGELNMAVQQWRKQYYHSETRTAEKEQEIGELSIQLDTERSTVAGLSEQVGALRVTQQTLADWDSTITTYRAEVRSKSELIASLRDELESAHEQNQTLRDRVDTIPQLEKELETKSHLAATLKTGVDTMRGYRTQAEQLESQLESMHVELEAAIQQGTQAADERDALERQAADERDALERQTAEAEEQHAAQQDRIENLEQEVLESQQLAARRHDELTALQSENDEFRRRAEHEHEFLGEISDGLRGFADDKDDLQAQLESWSDQLGPVASSLSDYEERVGDAEHGIHEALEHLRGQFDDAAQESERAQRLSDELIRERENSQYLQALLDKDRELIETLRAQMRHLPDLEMGLAGWQSQVAKLEEANVAKDKLIEGINLRLSEIAGRQVGEDQWQDELHDIKNQLTSKDARIDEMSRLTVDLRTQVGADERRRRTEYERLQSELAASAETIEELEAELEQRARQKPPTAKEPERDSGILVAMQKQLAEQTLINEEMHQAIAERDLEISSLKSLMDEKTQALPVLTEAVTEGNDVLPILRRVVGGAKSNIDDSD